MSKSIPVVWMSVVVLAAAVLVYANGLNGPFLFDDHVHIAQNRWVKIDSLDWHSLSQAWNSSFSAFPGNRPLAQLTFGINHAISGLDPFAFKLTNLVIHLLNGILVFILTRLVYRATMGPASDLGSERQLALVTLAFWLLHPMHVSTVLYPVQRMALLSTLSLLGALTVYFHGRLKMSRGERGAGWMVAAAPIALIGFLAKENTVLLPLLLLVSEITVLRRVSAGAGYTCVRLIWGLFIAAPLLLGGWYLISHHETLLIYDGRPFSLEERLLTQPRVLWLYLQWLFVPDISQFGLFHDDVTVSTGLLNPPTTIAAIIGLLVLLAVAIFSANRAPISAFAVLLFLASHALESTVLPLEMVFEHRNYLASVGPLILLAYLVTIASARLNVRPLAITVGLLLLLSYTVVTYLRVNNWSSYTTFVLTTAENHPNSSRSNFAAAKMFISALGQTPGDAPRLDDAARHFLQKGLNADARCINCLFGLVVLDLHQDRQPAPDLVARLQDTLRTGFVGPTKVSISQFSFLVKWQQSDGTRLAPGVLEGIFDAALDNPAWGHTARAGIEAAYREYYEFVREDLPSALIHAKAAVEAWPQQWNYHMQLVRLLKRLDRAEEASAAIDRAAHREPVQRPIDSDGPVSGA